jgi:hypothetical protein
MKSKAYFFFVCFVSKAQLAEQMIANYQKSNSIIYNSTTITRDFFSDKLYSTPLRAYS